MANVETPTGDKSQIIPEDDKKMDDKTAKLITIGLVTANVIAVIALILAFVGVVKNGSVYNIGTSGTSVSGGGSSSASVSNDDKIWVFQIGHFGANTQYLDEESGMILGYDVDVTNAICQLANKKCRLVWDLYERCWDSQSGERPRGGMGLMGSSWYDGCIGWYNTRDRARTFAFSTPIEKGVRPGIYVKKGSSNTFTWPNFNNKKIAFLDGWWIDERCLSLYNTTGFDPDDTAQVIHYQTEAEGVAALDSGEVDVGFLPIVSFVEDRLKLVFAPTNDRCANGGPGLMTAKDQFELLTWWNEAFDRLIATSQYNDICENIKEDHGGQPGDDPKDICVT